MLEAVSNFSLVAQRGFHFTPLLCRCCRRHGALRAKMVERAGPSPTMGSFWVPIAHALRCLVARRKAGEKAEALADDQRVFGTSSQLLLQISSINHVTPIEQLESPCNRGSVRRTCFASLGSGLCVVFAQCPLIWANAGLVWKRRVGLNSPRDSIGTAHVVKSRTTHCFTLIYSEQNERYGREAEATGGANAALGHWNRQLRARALCTLARALCL